MDILLSFPRSGNHLIRFIIEYIIGYPTKGCIDKDIPVYLNLYKTDKLMSHVIPEPFIIEKLHDSNSISNASSLIFIVRDFKECIPNHNNYNGDYRESMKLYIQNFIYYSNYKGPKLLIYYEDMIENSMTTIFSIINFIIQYNITLKNLLIHDNITTITNRLHYFIQNKKKLYEECLNAKGRYWGGNNSNNLIEYHFKRIPLIERQFIMNYMNKYSTTLSMISKYYTKIPVYLLLKGGLCNRLRCIEYYTYYCKTIDLTPYFIWNKSDACPGYYTDIFKENKYIIQDSKKVYIDYIGSKLTHFSDIHNKNIYEMLSLDIFKPTEMINEKVALFTSLLRNNFIAIHVRRTDHTLLAKKHNSFTPNSAFENFIEKPFFSYNQFSF